MMNNDMLVFYVYCITRNVLPKDAFGVVEYLWPRTKSLCYSVVQGWNRRTSAS